MYDFAGPHYIIPAPELRQAMPQVYANDFVGVGEDKTATPSTSGGGPSPDFDHQVGSGSTSIDLIGAAQGMEHLMGGSGFDPRGGSGADNAGRPQQQVVDLRRQLCDQNLFIFHLPSDWREAELKEAFSPFGNILSAKVVKRPDGSSKGYGFVCFEHQHDALTAASQMNGFSVGGKRLKVSLKKTPEECLNLQVKKLLEMAEQNEVFDRDRDCSLFVFHLPPHWDDKDLRDKFVPFGPVVAAKVSRKEDGTSRGYGFVTCSDPRSAAMAILNLNGLEVCNKRLKVQPKQMGSGTHPRPDCTIFVFHLPNDWTDAVLRQFFSSCGSVVSATVQRDPKGRSRGFGFVTFDRTQSARDAVTEMDGVSVGIKRLKVSLKRTTDGSQRSGGGGGGQAPSPTHWSMEPRVDDQAAVYAHPHQGSDDVRSWNSAVAHQAGPFHKDPPQRTDMSGGTNTDPYGDGTASFYPWKAAEAQMSAITSAPLPPQSQRAATIKNNAALAAYMPRYTDYPKPEIPAYPAAASSTLQHASMLLSPLLNNSVKNLQNQGAAVQQPRVHLATSSPAAPHLLAYAAGTFQQRPLWGLTTAGLQPTTIPYATHPSLAATARGGPSAATPTPVASPHAGRRFAPQQMYARPSTVVSRRPVRT